MPLLAPPLLTLRKRYLFILRIYFLAKTLALDHPHLRGIEVRDANGSAWRVTVNFSDKELKVDGEIYAPQHIQFGG